MFPSVGCSAVGRTGTRGQQTNEGKGGDEGRTQRNTEKGEPRDGTAVLLIDFGNDCRRLISEIAL